MAGDERVAGWIAEKLKSEGDFREIQSLGLGFLQLTRKNGVSFVAAATGVKEVISKDDISPLFKMQERQPEFVVNVPSKAIWTGAAIDLIHRAPAAFGTFGELVKASREDQAYLYRNKNFDFFERAFRQHRASQEVIRLYDKVFRIQRYGDMRDLTVAIIDAYDLSAEDIRNTRAMYGQFDIALKMTSYGSITSAATEAADSMGAETFSFGDFLRRLNKN